MNFEDMLLSETSQTQRGRRCTVGSVRYLEKLKIQQRKQLCQGCEAEQNRQVPRDDKELRPCKCRVLQTDSGHDDALLT